LAAGQAKLEEALDADERAIAESERLAAERRKKAARRARDLAVLVRGTDVLKALYQCATRLDPSDPEAWDEYARAALDGGRTAEAKTAFEQAALKVQDSNDPHLRYWAMLGSGDVAAAQGDLPSARQFYDAAMSVAEPLAKADPGNDGWQRDFSVSHNKIGDVLRDQGNLPAALESYRYQCARSLMATAAAETLTSPVLRASAKSNQVQITRPAPGRLWFSTGRWSSA
jgi:tetratricopeptide (TPR) repeat protein